MKNSVGLLLLLLVVSSVIVIWSEPIIQNLQWRRIDQAWTSLDLVGITASDALQDGIPDEWSVQSWGGAKRAYGLGSQEALAGKRAATVERTNAQGVVALAQRIVVTPNSQLISSVYAKGAAGAIQLRFQTKGTNGWLARGWFEIAPSGEWRQYRLSVLVPSDATEAEIRLRTAGLTWFDEAYIGMEHDGQLGPNLLKNPGFEQDGLAEDPLRWWQEHVISATPLLVSEDTIAGRLSLLNMVDMLNGQYGLIEQRAQQLGDRCVSAPDMTSWLLALGSKFEQEGGVAARERLYQLAIQLAPNCPQPYAVLAELYVSRNAYGAAAEHYHQAAEVASETAEAGRYYFEEGLLHVKYTGDMTQAISVLQRAEQLRGWERGTWYQGVASFYLGQALEAEGRLIEAAAAYQRIIHCGQCTYHHAPALSRLDALPLEKDDE